MTARKQPPGETILADRNEWDFSEIYRYHSDIQYFARIWEYWREGVRYAGCRQIPPPWLSFDPCSRPFIAGGPLGMPPIGAIREVDPKYSAEPDFNETAPAFAINWTFGQKEILKGFAAWLRARNAQRPNGTEKGGRKDAHMAALWDLAIYRILSLDTSSTRTCLELLRNTEFHKHRRSYFGSREDGRLAEAGKKLADARKRALEFVGTIGASEENGNWATLQMMRMMCAHLAKAKGSQ